MLGMRFSTNIPMHEALNASEPRADLNDFNSGRCDFRIRSRLEIAIITMGEAVVLKTWEQSNLGNNPMPLRERPFFRDLI